MGTCRYRVFDVHIHDPDIMNKLKREPSIVSNELLNDMNKLGVDSVFLIALEVDPSKISKYINKKVVFQGVEEIISYGNYRVPYTLSESLKDINVAIERHINIIKAAYTPTERVIKIARYSNKRIYPIGSMILPQNKDEIKYRVKGMATHGVIGFKIYPTLQFIDPSSNVLDPLYKVLAEENLILIVHTGCDPGLWELPNLCIYARPKRVEKVAKKYRDLKIILSHMGSYSGLRPGIFLDEALELACKYENIYLDTSAVESYIIDKAIKKCPVEKILFGSDYPMVNYTWEQLINDFQRLNIEEYVKRRVLWDNAIALLNEIGVY